MNELLQTQTSALTLVQEKIQAKPLIKIILKNYQVKMFLGFLEHEKSKSQNVSIDIELSFIKLAIIKDDVEDVFDYQHIIDVIDDLIKQPFNLQEFFIQQLADTLIDKIKGLDENIQTHLQPHLLLIRTQKTEAYEKAQSIGLEYLYTLQP